MREQRQQEFDDFVTQLKAASKSDKPGKRLHEPRLVDDGLTYIVWVVQKEMDKKRAEENAQRIRDEQASLSAEAERRRAEIRSSTN